MTPEMEIVDLKMKCVIMAGSEIPTANGKPGEWGAPSMDWDDDEEDEY